MLYILEMDSVRDDNGCFVCGKNNPIGLKLDFSGGADGAFAEIEFGDEFAGWSGIVHGGLLSTVIDEVLVKAAGFRGFRCVTAELTVRFRRPCRTRTKYTLTGKVLASRGRIIHAEGEILDASGESVVKGSGKLFIVNGVDR